MVGSDSVCWHPGAGSSSPQILHQRDNSSTYPTAVGAVPSSTFDDCVAVEGRQSEGTAKKEESWAKDETVGMVCKHDERRSLAGI